MVHVLFTFYIQGVLKFKCKTPVPKRLMVFENKVLRRIFSPTRERDGTWRIKTNDELDELIRHKTIINYIKAQILSWFGHLHRMPEERMVKRYISGKRC
jgi:hypothetical protein